MTKYTVTWSPEAMADLATLWLDAVDRDAVAESSDRIDVDLRWDAHLRGDERPLSKRTYYEWPLGVDFEVSEPDRMVRVLAVFRMKTGNGQA